MSVHKRVPSISFIYNTFNQTYFRYFYGHFAKNTKVVDSRSKERIQRFIDNQFHLLSYSLDKYEAYLLWLFSKYGKLPLISSFGHIDEYLKEEQNSLDIKPFSVIISKYIRENNIKSWKEYLLPQGNFYPKIIQHYMKDKSFPFEFLLYLKIFDRLPQQQKKMVKVLFRDEFYDLDKRLMLVNKNKHFFNEEIKKINKEFE